MKLIFELLLIGFIAGCLAQPYNQRQPPPPPQPSNPTNINNNNVNNDPSGGLGGAFGGGPGGAFGGGNPVRDFLLANRMPPWTLIQRTPWGPRLFFKRAAEPKVQILCIFNSTTSTLRCSGPSNVDCIADAITDKIRITAFNAFGISSTPVGDVVKAPEAVKYSLFPRKLDKTGWKHSKIRDSVSKAVHEYSIYSSPTFSDSGFRIRDPTCWKNLVSSFNSIQQLETVTLGTKPGRVDDVKIIGKIFIDRI